MALLLPTAAACARGRRAEPLPYIELVTGGAAADAELPLIIALHGRGDTAEDFAPLFRDFAVPARVAVLRPPHPWGGGQAWFVGARAHVDNRPVIAAELLALADRVVATAEAIRAVRPTRGRPVVMGFSQGGMLAWAVAVANPRAISASFPVAGFLFPEMLEKTGVDGGQRCRRSSPFTATPIRWSPSTRTAAASGCWRSAASASTCASIRAWATG